MLKRLLWLPVLALLFSPVFAGDPGPVAQKEISHLITRLGASGCRFNRNGSWYPPSEAVSHIRRKYEYLLEKGLVPTTEAFIERAASESSFSGKAYLVKCGEGAPVASAAWLQAELAKFRGESSDAPNAIDGTMR